MESKTPAEAFRKRLLPEELSGDSLVEELERRKFRELGGSVGGKMLIEHLERRKQWTVDEIMHTRADDPERVSFLQALHYFCSEYVTYLTPPQEDDDDAG